MALTAKQRQIALAIGGRVRAARARKSWSQERLSRATELSFTTISKIETGGRIPEWATLEKLADALEVDLADLMPDFASLGVSDQAHTRYIAQTLPGLPVPSHPRSAVRPNRQRRARISPTRATPVKVAV